MYPTYPIHAGANSQHKNRRQTKITNNSLLGRKTLDYLDQLHCILTKDDFII